MQGGLNQKSSIRHDSVAILAANPGIQNRGEVAAKSPYGCVQLQGRRPVAGGNGCGKCGDFFPRLEDLVNPTAPVMIGQPAFNIPGKTWLPIIERPQQAFDKCFQTFKSSSQSDA